MIPPVYNLVIDDFLIFHHTFKAFFINNILCTYGRAFFIIHTLFYYSNKSKLNFLPYKIFQNALASEEMWDVQICCIDLKRVGCYACGHVDKNVSIDKLKSESFFLRHVMCAIEGFVFYRFCNQKFRNAR